MSVPTYDLASLSYDSASTAYDGGGLVPSNMPVVGVFIAFDDTPYVAEPVWTEITQYVRDVNVKRGRQDDLQNFASGSANITLDNRLRIFDPFNTAGIYYGKLLPRRQIKVVAQYNSITYPIFRGYIAGFPVGYTQGGKDSTVQIDCFDAIGLLAAETTSNDWVYYYTNLLSPLHYWRCNDSQGSQVLVDAFAAGQPDLTMSTGSAGDFFIESPSMANGLLSESVYFNSYLKNAGVTSTTVADFTLMFWALNPSQQAGGSSTIGFGFNGARIELEWSNTANPYVDITNQTRRTRYTITGLNRQLPYHFAFAVSTNAGSDPTAVIYINGVATTFAPTFNAFVGTLNTLYINASRVQIQEIVAISGVATAAQVATVYEASVGRSPETTSERLTILAGLSSYPASLRSFSTSTVSTVSQLSSSEYILNEMQVNTDGESGELYVTSSGILKFVARDWFATSTRSNTSQMSFVDTGTGVYYDYASLRMAYDADLVRNDVTVSFTGNGNVNTTDATSVTTYGSASENLSTYLADPDQAETLSSYLVTIYKNPKLRVDPFMAKGQRNPTYDWQRLLALELLDRFTFVRTPSVGSAISQDMLLQSIEHRITAGTWETVINGSARFTGWFIIGTSLIGGTDVLL
jgi:hypothetical protein